MKGVFHIPKQILILIGLVAVFILVRTLYSGSEYYLFLFWNIFLAFVPFLISGIVMRMSENFNKKYLGVIIIGGILWLITFPNAPYLVTDVIHLGHNRLMPQWYDVILLFVTAWIGMLFTFYSLLNIEKALRTIYTKIKTGVFLGLLILISSFGIYVGRFLRWNSWDVITNPQELIVDVWQIFEHPRLHGEAYAFTFTMLLFIGASYYAWKSRTEVKELK